MKKSFLYGLMWSAWLGFWLGNLGCDATSIKFWFIFVPIIILADMETNARKNDE